MSFEGMFTPGTVPLYGTQQVNTQGVNDANNIQGRSGTQAAQEMANRLQEARAQGVIQSEIDRLKGGNYNAAANAATARQMALGTAGALNQMYATAADRLNNAAAATQAALANSGSTMASMFK